MADELIAMIAQQRLRRRRRLLPTTPKRRKRPPPARGVLLAVDDVDLVEHLLLLGQTTQADGPRLTGRYRR